MFGWWVGLRVFFFGGVGVVGVVLGVGGLGLG